RTGGSNPICPPTRSTGWSPILAKLGGFGRIVSRRGSIPATTMAATGRRRGACAAACSPSRSPPRLSTPSAIAASSSRRTAGRAFRRACPAKRGKRPMSDDDSLDERQTRDTADGAPEDDLRITDAPSHERSVSFWRALLRHRRAILSGALVVALVALLGVVL